MLGVRTIMLAGKNPVGQGRAPLRHLSTIKNKEHDFVSDVST
jgi:hypothetical protein